MQSDWLEAGGEWGEALPRIATGQLPSVWALAHCAASRAWSPPDASSPDRLGLSGLLVHGHGHVHDLLDMDMDMAGRGCTPGSLRPNSFPANHILQQLPREDLPSRVTPVELEQDESAVAGSNSRGGRSRVRTHPAMVASHHVALAQSRQDPLVAEVSRQHEGRAMQQGP